MDTLKRQSLFIEQGRVINCFLKAFPEAAHAYRKYTGERKHAPLLS
jgi:hypothetical protein